MILPFGCSLEAVVLVLCISNVRYRDHVHNRFRQVTLYFVEI